MFVENPRFPKTRARRFLVSGAVAAVVLAGCRGTGGQGDGPLEQRESEGEVIELLIRNNNFSQATVYLAPEFGTRRLGIVGGKSDATLKFKWHLPHIQLRVRFLAGSEILTDRLAVSPDDLLELQLPAGQP